MPRPKEPRAGRTRSLTLHIRGFEATDPQPGEPSALARIQARLSAITDAFVNQGAIPANLDPGVAVDYRDPGGGGGGPCAPEYVSIEIDVTASGLPEAFPPEA